MRPGVILIDKPAGMSSARAIAIVKKRLEIKKIGHAGTLDPMATGLLVALTDGATRLAQYAEGGRKVYSGSIQFGVVSDTDDITGSLTHTGKRIPSFADIEQAKSVFTGTIDQVPPNVSAVKIDGKRAYARTRRGEQITIAPRTVQVFSFTIEPAVDDRIAFRIECSKGTYIRSVARDLGASLGCGACLASLRREGSFPFSVAAATEPDDLTPESILDWDVIFPDQLRLPVARELCERLRNGDLRVLERLIVPTDANIAVYCDAESERPLGLLKRDEANWQIAVNLSAD